MVCLTFREPNRASSIFATYYYYSKYRVESVPICAMYDNTTQQFFVWLDFKTFFTLLLDICYYVTKKWKSCVWLNYLMFKYEIDYADSENDIHFAPVSNV